MEEYISREKVLADIRRAASRSSLGETTEPYLNWKEVVDYILDAPTVEVLEVNHGEWIRYPRGSGIYCSLCRHKRRYKDIHDKFCPGCGARMGGN